MLDKVKIYIESENIPRMLVTPTFDGIVESQLEKDIYFIDSVSSLFFNRSNNYADVIGAVSEECTTINVEIFSKCSGEYKLAYKGEFTGFDCIVDKKFCTIKANVKSGTGEQCLKDALKEDINGYNTQKIEVIESVSENDSYQKIDITYFRFSEREDDYLLKAKEWLNEPYDRFSALPNNRDQDDFYLVENIVTTFENFSTVPPDHEAYEPPYFVAYQRTRWVGEIADVPCVDGEPVPPSGAGWELSKECNNGVSVWKRYPYLFTGVVLGPYTNGRRLNQMLQDAFLYAGCPLPLRSEFFGINATGDKPNNRAYNYAENYLQNISVHQKSDIKRPDASNQSTAKSWKVKLQDFIEDIELMFNVRTGVVDGEIRIEHYTYKQLKGFYDLSGKNHLQKYDHSGNQDVKKETFEWMDKAASEFFKGFDIVYDCGSETKDRKVKLVSTDLYYVEGGPSGVGEEDIEDKGFVFIANELNENGEYVIIDNNRPLSWVDLHYGLHMDGRLYKSGSLNGQNYLFSSYIPYKKATDEILEKLEGAKFLNEAELITDIGAAVTQSAKRNLFTDSVTLEIKYI